MSPDASPSFKSGFVCLVGRPNAGKSTLINALLGKKIAITSDKAQTTRHRFRAILNAEGCQIILVDTPGIHKSQDALGDELNTSALKALDDVDVIACLIDASAPVGRGDEWVSQAIASRTSPKLLVLSKTDKVDDERLAKQRAAALKLCSWDAVCELSAQTGAGLEGFLETVKALLPEGPRWFPTDMDTDQPLEVLIAEFIREKALRMTHDEVPHAIGVATDEMSYDRRRKLYSIDATIYVERESQKGIIIGAKGASIKAIGTEARHELETLLGAKVYLNLRVKLRKHWRRDLNQIRRFGYGEGN